MVKSEILILIISDGFTCFTDLYKVKGAFKKDEKKYLSYWIKKAIQKGRDDIRILSSLDDMINDRVDPDLANGPYMMTIPHGGHFGYRQMAWFDELLIKSFGLNLNAPKDLNDLKLALFQTREDQ